MRKRYEEWQKEYVVKFIGKDGYEKEKCGVIPIEIATENKLNKNSHVLVSGVCKLCGKDYVRVWRSISKSKAVPGESYCGSCANKLYRQTPESRKINSENQLRVQGTPEARERMSKILIEKHKKDPSIGRRISDGLRKVYLERPELKAVISENSKKAWKKEGYQQKVTGFGYFSGYYVENGNNIFFASSWELKFILWCRDNKDVKSFCRCEDWISYFYKGSKSNYNPDFEVVLNNKIYVFEIKGKKSNADVVEKKRLAAIEFYKGQKEYVLLFKEDLKRMGISMIGHDTYSFMKNLSDNGIIKMVTFGKDNKKEQQEVRLQRILKKKEASSKKRESKKIKSLYPQVLLDWDYELNSENPDDILVSSRESFHFKCHVCRHKWEAKMYTRVHNKIGCPACRSKRISEVRKTAHAKQVPIVEEKRKQIAEESIEKAIGYYKENKKWPKRKFMFDNNIITCNTLYYSFKGTQDFISECKKRIENG